VTRGIEGPPDVPAEEAPGVPKSLAEPPDVLHPRGRLSPPLGEESSRLRRGLRGVVRLVQGIYHHDDIFHMAPAMAFHFFLSLLPLLAFTGYVLGRVAKHEGVSEVLRLVVENLPSSTRAVFQTEVSQLAAADRLAPLAAVGFLWIASGGIQGLMQAIERVVGAPRRAWWRQRLLALGWVFAMLVAFGVASVGIFQWEEIVDPKEPATAMATMSATPTMPEPSMALDGRTTTAGADRRDDGAAVEKPSTVRAARVKRVRRVLRAGGERVLAMVASVFIAVGGLAAFYQFSIAHSRRVRRRVVPGALLAMALVSGISSAFGLYLRTLASYTVYYGSLAAIAVLLVWLWLMSLALLVGAELNSQLEGLRD
jgi:membrane protein